MRRVLQQIASIAALVAIGILLMGAVLALYEMHSR
jgi:tetrahydromethanopterin S-methyltransferase subunit D